MGVPTHRLLLGMGSECRLLCCADLLYKKKRQLFFDFIMFNISLVVV